MSVANVTELSAVSEESFEDAIRQAIGRANETLRNLEGAWVKDMNVLMSDGNLRGYKVNLLLLSSVEHTPPPRVRPTHELWREVDTVGESAKGWDAVPSAIL